MLLLRWIVDIDSYALKTVVSMHPEKLAFCAVVHVRAGTFRVVHARKAWLSGLSPMENRELPPLRYEVVHRVKADFPELKVIVSGGIRTTDQALHQLEHVDGVMIGREAYQNPYVLAELDRAVCGTREPIPDRAEIVYRLLPYVRREVAGGTPLKAITRHILGLFNRIPGARLAPPPVGRTPGRRARGHRGRARRDPGDTHPRRGISSMLRGWPQLRSFAAASRARVP